MGAFPKGEFECLTGAEAGVTPMNLQVWVKQLREVAVVGCAWDGERGVSGDKRCHHLHPAGVALEKEMEMGWEWEQG